MPSFPYWGKYGMNFLMNPLYQLGIIGILAVGGWLVLQVKTEVGMISAEFGRQAVPASSMA